MENDILSLEFYPSLSENEVSEAKDKINANKDHWEVPFFMEVYKYADVNEFRKICEPFLNDSIKNIIILGTGGSYQTLKGLSLFTKNTPKTLHFLTSSRPYELKKVLDTTSPADSVVVPISRGGKTLDVNSIIPLFKNYKMIALSSRGPMNDLVKKLDAKIIDVPDLSGRFAASVCSVLLVPAILANLDVSAFQKGLGDGYTAFKNLGDGIDKNLALSYAIFLDKLYKRGYRNIFSMSYSKWLEGLVGLFVQEISESSGKEGNGFIGTSQPAPLCQHSVLELILGGSKGHTTPLLWTIDFTPEDIPLIGIDGFNNELKGMGAQDVINYQLDATFEALLKQNIPSGKISLKSVSMYSLGIITSFIQTTVYYYCLLTDVNWSSNPLVNTGKLICNEAIQNKLNAEERKKKRLEYINLPLN